ncbi:hypothetical protein C1T17_03895 [Sphingobium sp. SCG-1]|nr:hypothetical protein C1T17_03895 [Sphingobium sp. SCG-1]
MDELRISEELRLLDENEQLRVQLETALEENQHISEDRDQLLVRVADLAMELRAETRKRLEDDTPPAVESGVPLKKETGRSETEEELRVAFEELQVLTEELEVANTTLQQFNAQLEERVAARTREIVDANAALRRSEAALQAVANVVPDLLWRTDHIGRTEWVNRRWSDYTGKSVGIIVSTGWLSVLHPDDRPAAEEAFMRSLRDGVPYQQEHRMLGVHNNYRWFMVRAEPMRDDRGNIVAWFGAAMDMHDQLVSMQALKTSEARFRTLIEGMPQLVWRSANGAQWTWSSPQWGTATGQSDWQSWGRGWLDAFHPDDKDSVLSSWEKALEEGILEFEGRVFSAAEGRYRYFQTRALPVRREDGQIVEWLGTSTDVDDLVRLQNEQTVLVSELQHRTRNLMAVVQAVITKTIKNSDALHDFTARIGDRMQALARVQGLLSRRAAGTRIAFDWLLKEELSAHASLDEGPGASKITLNGPEGILLSSSTIQTFALALHELATNAVKYGALASASGHLSIEWSVVKRDDDGSHLLVHWRETGVGDTEGADRDAPDRMGYGRELIERALPYQLGARTRYRFTDDGIECSIEVQIPDVAALNDELQGSSPSYGLLG